MASKSEPNLARAREGQEHPLSDALVEWFEREALSYPWRETHDPWAVFVSEMMLQQTTIATVLGRYEAWMRLYPTPAHLAAASEQQALRSWEGLGYYRRVRNLRAAAIRIVEEFGGIFPTLPEDISSLAGVGDYTLGAILSFAYNKPASLLDANVSRVLARVLNDQEIVDSSAGKKRQWAQADDLLHHGNPRAYNAALMELGQRVCTLAAPRCAACPIGSFCLAESPEELPRKKAKPVVEQVQHWDIFLLDEQRGLLLQRQGEGQRHEGMYRFPTREEGELQDLELMATQRYRVTRYQVTRYLYRALSGAPVRVGEEFVPLAQLPHLPMASPDRKLVIRFLGRGA